MTFIVLTTAAVLTMGPMAAQAAAQSAPAAQTRATDEQLMSEVATKIANDKSLGADAVKVTVKNGVVTLSGMVARDADKATAEELAHVPGVVRVENKLTSRQKATDTVQGTAGTAASKTKEGAAKTADKTVEVSKKVAGKTKDVSVKTAENVTDGWITSRIKTKFMADEALRASSINVDTNDHVVTLHGAVPNEAARVKALATAKDVEGVNRVVDNLKVTGK